MGNKLELTTSEIEEKVLNHITEKYKGDVKNFLKTELFNDMCLRVIRNKELLSNVIFANDMEVAPVKSLLKIYERDFEISDNFDEQTRKSIGAVMGYLFRFVFGYKGKVENCTIGKFGFRGASRFTDGPIIKLV